MTNHKAVTAGQPCEGETVGGALDCSTRRWQSVAGATVLAVAFWMAWAAWQIPGAQGLQLAQAAWVPALCALALAVCGAWLLWEARTGGWRNTDATHGMAAIKRTPWIWVCAGLLLNVLLIAQIGFVLACALCYVLAVQGLRRAAQESHTLALRGLLQDAALGLGLSALVLALFTRVLDIGLPVLTASGWL